MKKNDTKKDVSGSNIVFQRFSIVRYMRIVKQPLLTAKEEKELIVKAKKGDLAARQKLIEANLGLVVANAVPYANVARHLKFDDLISEGTLGLIEAIKRFKPEVETRFSTYATWWIKQAITRAISDKDAVVRFPVHITQKKRAYRRALKDLLHEVKNQPSMEQIAEKMGVGKNAVIKIEGYMSATISLDRQTHGNEEGVGDELYNFIYMEEQASPEAIVAEELIQQKKKSQCMAAILGSSLNEKEETIIKMRFGFNEEERSMKFEEIAKKLGISKQRVQQIEVKALNKMKKKYGKVLREMLK